MTEARDPDAGKSVETESGNGSRDGDGPSKVPEEKSKPAIRQISEARSGGRLVARRSMADSPRRSAGARVRAFLGGKFWAGIGVLASIAIAIATFSDGKNSPEITAVPRPTVSVAPLDGALCRTGVTGEDIVDHTLFDDQKATVDKILDFDQMNGSVRHAKRDGRVYYWGRVGSDDDDRQDGGVQLLWRVGDQPWRSCRVDLSAAESGYVWTPAIARNIGGESVSVKICIWRRTPHEDNCWG
jgi:hypothetical protein